MATGGSRSRGTTCSSPAPAAIDLQRMIGFRWIRAAFRFRRQGLRRGARSPYYWIQAHQATQLNTSSTLRYLLAGPGIRPIGGRRPRNGSIYGSMTIEVCDLNRLDFRELRQDHFRSPIAPQVKALNKALNEWQPLAIQREFERALGLLEPGNTDVGFTYDALRASIPDSKLRTFLELGWPAPNQVG